MHPILDRCAAAFRRTGPLGRLLAEPLAQFALIGLVLFVADRLTAEPEVDPNRIVIDASVYRELATLHRDARGTLPTREKMEELVRQYATNETLLREARALRLDEGDQMMRERMIQRVRLMIYNGVALEPPSREALRAWFEERRDGYVRPPRITFDLVALDGTEAEARALAERMNAGGEPARGEGQILSFRERLRPQVVSLLGETVVAALEAGEVGRWRALASPNGWQVARHLGTDPARVPEFEAVENQVRGEWQRIETQRAAIAALDALRAQYPVERAPVDPDLLADPTAANEGGAGSEAQAETRSGAGANTAAAATATTR